MIQFILGAIIGGFIGIVAVAMSVAAKEDNRYRVEQ